MKKIGMLIMFFIIIVNSFAKFDFDSSANSLGTYSLDKDAFLEVGYVDSYVVMIRYIDEIIPESKEILLTLINEKKEILKTTAEFLPNEDGENIYACFTFDNNVLEFFKRTNNLTIFISDGKGKEKNYLFPIKGFETELKSIVVSE